MAVNPGTSRPNLAEILGSNQSWLMPTAARFQLNRQLCVVGSSAIFATDFRVEHGSWVDT